MSFAERADELTFDQRYLVSYGLRQGMDYALERYKSCYKLVLKEESDEDAIMLLDCCNHWARLWQESREVLAILENN